MIIKNGFIFLPEKNKFEKKDIKITKGIIVEISDNIITHDYIEATGKYITPGLIDAHSHIGMCEEGIGWEGDDICELSDPVMPILRAIDAINPFDTSIKEALESGVTTVCTGPGSANVIAGSFTTISLFGNIIDEMIIDEYAAMKCAFGENPKSCFGKMGKEPHTRMGVAALMRKNLNDTINYQNKKNIAKDKKEFFSLDLSFEQMLPIINREKPFKAHVHRADDICTAIRIAKEFNLKLTLDHCTEGHLIVDYLKTFDYPAIIGPSFGSKTKVETKNKTFSTAKILNEAGIKICLTTDHDVLPQHSLKLCAALAIQSGLNPIEALKAITINPAEVLGIDHLKGNIKIGLEADLVIWDQFPLDFYSKVEMLFIKGNPIF